MPIPMRWNVLQKDDTIHPTIRPIWSSLKPRQPNFYGQQFKVSELLPELLNCRYLAALYPLLDF